MTEFYVNLSPTETQRQIDNIIGSSVSGEAIDQFVTGNGENAVCISVYEKYYYRAGNRLTLTSVVTRALPNQWKTRFITD